MGDFHNPIYTPWSQNLVYQCICNEYVNVVGRQDSGENKGKIKGKCSTLWVVKCQMTTEYYMFCSQWLSMSSLILRTGINKCMSGSKDEGLKTGNEKKQI